MEPQRERKQNLQIERGTNTYKKAREITARCVISRIMSDNASASGARPCADPLCGGKHEQIIFNLVKVYFNLKPRAKAGPRGEGLDPETVIDPMCVLRRPVHQETWKTGALGNLPLWRDA